MSRNRLVLLALAGAAALFAAYLASNLQPSAPQTAEQAAPAVETVEVMVAGRDVPFAGQLDDAAISWAAWPRSALRAEMITRDDQERVKQVTKGRVRVPVYQGEPLDLRKVVPEGDVSFMSAILPKGHRAVPISVTPLTSSGGFILPGDRVDVMLQRSGGAVPVIKNVRVLAIDQTFRRDEKGEQVLQGTMATLDLDLEQAHVISVLNPKGGLALALRSIADNDVAAPEADVAELTPEFKRTAAGGIAVIRAGAPSIMTSN